MARWKTTKWVCLSALSMGALFGCGEPLEESGVEARTAALSSSQGQGQGTARYLVGAPTAAAKAAVATHGRIALELPHGALAAYLSAHAVEALRKNPLIGEIERDPKRFLYGAGVPAGEPYGAAMVQADQLSPGVEQISVCVIDSGLAAHTAAGEVVEHPELRHVAVTASPDPGTGDPLFDDNGHGTHVAGTIAGLEVGVAPDSVRLHVVKVFTAEGWAYSSSLQDAAYRCAEEGGARVINMSLGGTMKSRWEEAAFDDLGANYGVLSIAAAGNDGNTRRSYPASYDSVVSVAAVDASAEVAGFSQQNDQVELSAPGVAVWSSTPWLAESTVTAGGVSHAANHLEGAPSTSGASGEVVDAGLCDQPVADSAGKVVLCQRGSISFAQKVNNAAGAAAVVIYNDEPGEFLGTCSGACPDGPPAVTVSDAAGAAILGESTATVISASDAEGRGYEAWSGTSMATPHVVGVAALLWGHFPDATAVEIRDALAASALDKGASGRDSAYGYGLVQAKAAYDLLAAGSSSGGASGGEGGGESCTLAAVGEVCREDVDCCSGVCARGKPSQRVCLAQ